MIDVNVVTSNTSLHPSMQQTILANIIKKAYKYSDDGQRSVNFLSVQKMVNFIKKNIYKLFLRIYFFHGCENV